MPDPSTGELQEALGRKPRDDEIDFFGLTHQGKVRKSNNDHFLVASLSKRMDVWLTSLPGFGQQVLGEQRLAFIAMVADGVGGTETGEEASRIALESVTEYIANSLQAYYSSADARDEAFRGALQEAASRGHASAVKRAKDQGDSRKRATTLTLWLGVWPWLYLLQVGDSRYYKFCEGDLQQITRDQTYAQDLLDAGALSKDQAKDSPLKHVLSSALGGDQTAPVVTRIPADWRNLHLMCSDGLTKHVSDERIREVLMNFTTARQACETLLQDALDDGGTDNITIVVLKATKKL